MNAGGPNYVDITGIAYQRDAPFSSGGSAFATIEPIGASYDETLYQGERYGNFFYNIPVPNGNYRVVL